MTSSPIRLFCLRLLLCGIFCFFAAPTHGDTSIPLTTPPTAAQAGEASPQADTPPAIMPDPGYSEEEIRRARNRLSLQIFAASALLGTIIVISIIVWAHRKRHAEGLDRASP